MSRLLGRKLVHSDHDSIALGREVGNGLDHRGYEVRDLQIRRG